MNHKAKILLLSLLQAFLINHCNAQEKIVISTYEWPPEQSQSLPNNGIVLHIITEIFNNANIDVEYKWYPNHRATVMAMKGKVDGMATMGYSDERAAAMHVSDSVISAVTRFYHMKDFPFDWNNMNDLATLPGKVGITGEYNYGDEFNEAVMNKVFKVDKAINDIMNFKKLMAGRIKLFPMTTGIAEHMILTQLKPGAMDQITYHPKPVRTFDSFLYFSKARETSTKFLEIFNAGLKDLKDSGRYSEMIAAYERGEYSK